MSESAAEPLEQEACYYCGTTSLSGCLPSLTIEVEMPEATSTFHRTACQDCVVEEVLGDD